jgi:hypothetical protein
MTLASASCQVGCPAARRFPPETPPPVGGPESGETDAPEAVFAVNQGAQAVLNAMRRPKRGVDYAFNTPGAAPSGGCAARRV